MIKDYYFITKPGIIYGNAITVVAGFIIASRGHVDWGLLFVVLVGLSLVVASGCVLNNYIDRDIDGIMERTKNRALVIGSIAPKDALIFGKILAILGLGILFFYTNLLTVAVSFLGLIVYVVVYSLCLKRSAVGTIVGSISGAVPPLAGYLAVSWSFDLGALILFFVLVFWQMPHSFAIAIYRLEDYKKAGIPVLPVKKGILITKIQTLVYVALFVMATFALSVFGYAGYEYLLVMAILGICWLALCATGFYTTNDKLWARRMSVFSLVVVVTFCITVIVDSY